MDANDNYQASVNFNPTDYYTGASASTAFKVNKAPSNVKINNFNDFKYGTNQNVSVDHINTTSITATIGLGDYIELNGYTITLKAGLTVGKHTLKVTGKGDKNHEDSEDSYTFNVLRVDKVWISEDGTGLGLSESDPTTWDKVEDILTDDGTVVFVGNFDEFYNKTISKPWTLTSNSNSVINANKKGNIFDVESENVKIYNLTFTNGYSDSSYGAIFWNGANGVLSDCSFENNTVYNGYSGAINWSGDSGTIINCNFTNNKAISDGGAIYIYGDNNKVLNSNFVNNSADNGGAIFNNGAHNTISNSNFINNTADYGGAINVYWGEDTKVDKCNFTNNTADYGGAIYWDYGSDGIINNSIFAANKAGECRNIYEFNRNTELSLENSKLETIVTITQVADGPFNCTRVIEGTFDEGTNLDGYTVKLLNNGGEVTTLTINDDKTFSYSWNNLNVGDYSITLGITNNKGNVYVTDYKPMIFKIYKTNSSVSIDEISTVDYPNNVTVNFNVLNKTTVTYIVKTKDGKTVIKNTTVDAGVRVLNLSGLGAGEYTITIANAENANFIGNEASADFKVNKSPSSLDDLTPVVFDYDNSATISVGYSGATNVTAYVVGHTEALVVVGDHSITVSGLDAGEYTLNVTTIPDGNHTAVSKTTNVKVNQAASSVNFNDTSFVYNAPVEITVVTQNSTGDVKVNLTYVNGTPITSGITVSGNKITITGLKVNNYTLTVTTNPDNNHNESTQSKSLKITKANDSGFYVEAIPRIFDYLESTVLVPTFNYPVTGTVTFIFDDSTEDVTINVDENYTYTPKYAGKHNVVAVFSGDDNFNSATRDHVNITVDRLNPNFHITDGSVEDLEFGQNVTVRTVVDSRYTDLVSGNVTFYFSNGTNKTVKIGESIVYTPYKAGDRVLRAVYDGDRNFIGGSDQFTIKVTKSKNSGFNANLTPDEINFDGSTVILGNVTNALATGNVTYILPGNVNETFAVGTPFTYTPTVAGTHHIIVKYSGDDNFAGNDGIELILKVNKIDAGFNASANKTEIAFENGVKLNSSVIDSRATGSVTYTFDDGTLELVKNITDEIVYIPKSAGEHNITVKYSGDTNFYEATKTITINVAKSDASGFNSIANPDTIDLDKSTNLISTVSNNKAGGNVTYRFDDGTVVVRSSKDNWNYTYTPKSAGRHIVNVTYSGDDNFNGSTLNVTVTVNKIDAGFDAYVNVNSKDYLVPFIIYNKFADSRATGTITYYLTNGTNMTVNVGESVTFTPTYAGEHYITVKYSGDGNFTNATDIVKFNVTKSNNHGFYVEVNPRVFSYLGNTTLKGTLLNGATGKVRFEFDDGTASVTVLIGEEVVYTPRWAGQHNITATYLGDDNFNDNTRKINITVNRLDPNFHISDGNIKDLTFGENVTVKTVVDDKYINLVSGNVTFYFSNGTNTTVKIGESIVYTPYKAGERILRAVYDGDVNFLGGNSQLSLIVKKSDKSGFNANLNPAVIDLKESTIILGNVTNPLATGNVTYVLPGNVNETFVVGTPFTYTPIAAGTHHIIVKYSGDDNFVGNEGIELILTVNKIDAGFDSSANDSDVVYGDSIKLNSSVLDSLATGTVSYKFDDGTSAELNKQLSDVITYTPQSAGYHNITVTYSGDNNFKNATKVIRIYVAKSDESGFDSKAVPDTIDFLKSTTLTSTTTNPNARGNVTYRFDDGTEIVVRVSKDSWNYIYTPKTAGTHTVNVTYSGDDNFNGVSLNVTVTVNKIDAGFDAYTLRNSTVYLDSVTLYNKFNNTRATGNVTFYLTNGSEVTVNARESVKFIPTYAGEHTIVVKYSGDDNFNESTDTIKFNITKSNKSLFDAFAKPTEFWFEQNTSINSTIGNGATGKVTYVFDDGTESVTKDIGEAFIYKPRHAGEHIINATYNGDDNFNKASVLIKITVHEIGAGFHISANKTIIVYGDKVLINSTVLDPLATGTVTYFFENKTNITYNLGETFVYLPLSAGTHVLNATYNGNDDFTPENDSLIITVLKSDNAGFNANVTPIVIDFEGNATVLGWITNANATGNVTYHLPNGTDIEKPVGTPIVVVPTSTDDYHITVDYSGDGNYNGVNGIELTLKVNPIDAGFNSSANMTYVVYGNSIKINSSVLDSKATGNVTYEFDDGTVFEVDRAISDVIIYTPKSAGPHTVTVI